MCFTYIMKRNFVAKLGNVMSFVSHCLLYLCIWPVLLVLVVLLL